MNDRSLMRGRAMRYQVRCDANDHVLADFDEIFERATDGTVWVDIGGEKVEVKGVQFMNL